MYLLLLVSATMPKTAFAQTTSGADTISAITTAVPFLTISPNARNGSLGETGVANTYDASAEFWNPAALAFAENKFGFQVGYSPWLRALNIPDINLAYLPAYYNFGEQGGVAALSLRFFSLGNIQFTDEQGNNIGQYNASEFALGTSYAHVITEKLAIGGGLRYVRSDLAGGNVGGLGMFRAANTACGDIALMYRTDFEMGNMPSRFGWGVNIQNIGAKVSYNDGSSRRDFLPTMLRLGWSLRTEIDDYNSFAFMNDFTKLLVPSAGGASQKNVLSGMFGSFGDAPGGFKEELREINLSLGAEYGYNDLFFVRAGYFYEHKLKGNRQFLTLGAGLKFKVFTLDVSYLTPFTQNHPLQNTLRFTLGFDFN